MNFRKFFKIAAIVASILLFIGIILSALVYFYIKPILIKEMNKQLTVNVDVGRISVSKWSNFPKIGVNFNNLTIPESQPHFKKPFLQAKNLSLYVDVFSLLSTQKKIDGLALEDGEVNLAFLGNATNFDIVKPTDHKEEGAFDFDFKKISLKQIRLNIYEKDHQVEIASIVKNIDLRLRLSDQKNIITPKGVVFVTQAQQFNKTWVQDKDLTFDLDIHFNGNYSKMELHKGQMGVNRVSFDTKGTVYFEKNYVDLNIEMQQNESKISDILHIVAKEDLLGNTPLDLGGNLKWKATLKGKSSKTQSPEFALNFQWLDGVVKGVNSNFDLNKVTINGNAEIPDFNQLQSGKLHCNISGNKSSLGDASGIVTVKDFINPNITWEGTISLDPKLICNLANLKYKKAEGNILLDGQIQFGIDGKKGTIKPNSFDFFGNLVGDDLSLDLQDKNFEMSETSFELVSAATDLSIQYLKLKQGNTEWNWEGLLKRKNAIFDENSTSEFIGKVLVKNLNLDDFIREEATTSQEVVTTSNIGMAIFLPIKTTITAQIEQFTYNKFEAKTIKGKIVTSPNSYECINCDMEALKGKVKADIIFRKHNSQYLLDIISDVQKVEVKELFTSFNNFDQEEITANHISGLLSGKLIVKQVFDENLNPILDNLYVKTQLILENGRLQNYEPLKSLSKFAKVDDLQNLSFKTLSNEIEIFNQTIFIPKMDIVSNAINLKLEGSHTFDNYMDYSIEVSLAKILANKSKWFSNKQENNFEDNEMGGLTAFILMQGTPDNLDIKYDRTKSRKQVREEIKQERENLRKLIRTGEEVPEKSNKNYDNRWDE